VVRAALARRETAVFAAAYGAVLLWGATPMATKVAVMGMDPIAAGVLRTVVAAAAALPLVIVGRLAPPSSAWARAHLAVSALGGFVLFPLLFSLGLARTSAGHGALLLGILPVLTGMIAAALDRRAPERRWWLGCAVAVVGTVLLVDERFGLAGTGGDLIGNLLVLAGAVAAAAGYVTGARAAREIGTWPVTLWGLLIGAVLLMPALPFTLADAGLGSAGIGPWSAVFYLAVVSSIVGYGAWYWALGRGGIGRTGLAQFVQPVVGLMFAVALLGEPLTWPMLVAAGVILGGVALARGRA
jgi:drug/metabolite transporter (DMT)-like permease